MVPYMVVITCVPFHTVINCPCNLSCALGTIPTAWASGALLLLYTQSKCMSLPTIVPCWGKTTWPILIPSLSPTADIHFSCFLFPTPYAQLELKQAGWVSIELNTNSIPPPLQASTCLDNLMISGSSQQSAFWWPCFPQWLQLPLNCSPMSFLLFPFVALVPLFDSFNL